MAEMSCGFCLLRCVPVFPADRTFLLHPYFRSERKKQERPPLVGMAAALALSFLSESRFFRQFLPFLSEGRFFCQSLPSLSEGHFFR